MDTLVDGLTYVFVLGAFVPLSAVVKPWGPFKRRWIGGVAALLAFIVGGMLIVMPPERPAAIAQAEWDRRIALCREHADGQFRDCVRDTAELKKAEQRADESKRAKLAEKSVSAAAKSPGTKIDPSVLKAYTRKDDPDIFAAWGTKGVQRIEDLRKTAADGVAKQDKCDAVDVVDIADQRSKAPSKITIYVQCHNEARYFLTQAEIGRGVFLSEDDRDEAVKAVPFRNACSEGTQSMLRYPSSYDQHIFGGGTFTDDDGNHGIAVDFDAQNGFGNKIPQVALCTLMPDGKIKIRIHNR
jgi:hypothetical protein